MSVDLDRRAEPVVHVNAEILLPDVTLVHVSELPHILYGQTPPLANLHVVHAMAPHEGQRPHLGGRGVMHQRTVVVGRVPPLCRPNVRGAVLRVLRPHRLAHAVVVDLDVSVPVRSHVLVSHTRCVSKLMYHVSNLALRVAPTKVDLRVLPVEDRVPDGRGEATVLIVLDNDFVLVPVRRGDLCEEDACGSMERDDRCAERVPCGLRDVLVERERYAHRVSAVNWPRQASCTLVGIARAEGQLESKLIVLVRFQGAARYLLQPALEVHACVPRGLLVEARWALQGLARVCQHLDLAASDDALHVRQVAVAQVQVLPRDRHGPDVPCGHDAAPWVVALHGRVAWLPSEVLAAALAVQPDVALVGRTAAANRSVDDARHVEALEQAKGGTSAPTHRVIAGDCEGVEGQAAPTSPPRWVSLHASQIVKIRGAGRIVAVDQGKTTQLLEPPRRNGRDVLEHVLCEAGPSTRVPPPALGTKESTCKRHRQQETCQTRRFLHQLVATSPESPAFRLPERRFACLERRAAVGRGGSCSFSRLQDRGGVSQRKAGSKRLLEWAHAS
mmetsp:Transcript_48630/g.135879  ORF Transcript_48630/g.135879 Transcript_48630/m.135879 type:complete len:558 (-) Transcript_48630:38-1711(-)